MLKRLKLHKHDDDDDDDECKTTKVNASYT
jgi:hypothetical protein